MGKYVKNIKVAENLPISSVKYLIMLHVDGNVDIKFQPSIIYRDQDKYVSPKHYKNRKTVKVSDYDVRKN